MLMMARYSWHQRHEKQKVNVEDFSHVDKISEGSVWLVCPESVAVKEEYTLRRTKHSFKSYTGSEREQKVKQLVAPVSSIKPLFCVNKVQENAKLAS